MNFIWIDWAVVIAFVSLTTCIAVFTRKLISNYDSFLLAGRSLKLYLGMATMGATELGLVTLMYFSEQGYKSGFSAFTIGLISLLGFMFVGKTGFIIKGLRELHMRTIAEFFWNAVWTQHTNISCNHNVCGGPYEYGFIFSAWCKVHALYGGLAPRSPSVSNDWSSFTRISLYCSRRHGFGYLNRLRSIYHSFY